MSVITKRRKGLQSRGKTSIDADLTIEKFGTVVSVSDGTYVDINGNEYSVNGTRKDIGKSKNDRKIGVYIVDTGNSFDVKIGERSEVSGEVLQVLVYPDWFKVPANTSDLSNVDMYAFGWIDENPEEVEKQLPDNSEALQHKDLQKLKRDGKELTVENKADLVIQKPENKKANKKAGEKVRPVTE